LNPRASIEQAEQVWSSLVAGEDIESLGRYSAAEDFAIQTWSSLVEGEDLESSGQYRAGCTSMELFSIR
jgi:hypothetical protein